MAHGIEVQAGVDGRGGNVLVAEGFANDGEARAVSGLPGAKGTTQIVNPKVLDLGPLEKYLPGSLGLHQVPTLPVAREHPITG